MACTSSSRSSPQSIVLPCGRMWLASCRLGFFKGRECSFGEHLFSIYWTFISPSVSFWHFLPLTEYETESPSNSVLLSFWLISLSKTLFPFLSQPCSLQNWGISKKRGRGLKPSRTLRAFSSAEVPLWPPFLSFSLLCSSLYLGNISIELLPFTVDLFERKKMPLAFKWSK